MVAFMAPESCCSEAWEVTVAWNVLRDEIRVRTRTCRVKNLG